MSGVHILDILAARRGCLCRMDEDAHPLSQWQDAVRYLTGDERDFASVKEIKEFILKEMEAVR